MNNALQQKLLEIINQLQHHSPVAMSLVLKSIQMDAINDIFCAAWSIPFFVVAAVIFFTVTRPEYLKDVKRNAEKDPRKKYDMDQTEGDVIALSSIGCVILSIIGIIVVAANVSFWTFVAIQHPEVWLAHLAVSKVL